MRFALVFLGAGSLVGCGWSEARFIDEYVEVECGFLLECNDPAVNTFLGWESLEDCIDDRGPRLARLASSCEYHREAARPCVQELEEVACPPDGEELDYPPLCEQVYQDCGDGTFPSESDGHTLDTGTE